MVDLSCLRWREFAIGNWKLNHSKQINLLVVDLISSLDASYCLPRTAFEGGLNYTMKFVKQLSSTRTVSSSHCTPVPPEFRHSLPNSRNIRRKFSEFCWGSPEQFLSKLLAYLQEVWADLRIWVKLPRTKVRWLWWRNFRYSDRYMSYCNTSYSRTSSYLFWVAKCLL